MYNAKAKKMVSALLIASMVTFGAGFTNINSESNKANAVQQIQPLQGKVVMVPAGTAIPATATMELSSENLSLGQGVCIALSNNFYYNNTLVAPLGSSVNGTVIQVKKA